ncbi:MAG: TldD/PmbA family protein [Armatimonadetes bacterium]|nr:TldD/PmbA family protein [Armatimonadota bacterium]
MKMSDGPMDDLLKAAEIACQSALKAGADFADAFVERGRDVAVSVEKNAIDSTGSRMSASISVRAFADGGTGWWSTSTTTEEAARGAGEQAARLARAAEPDPDFVSLVDPQVYPEIEGLYDEALVELTGSQVADWITTCIDEARDVASDGLVSGEAEAYWREGVIANSLGVQAVRRTTRASVYAQVVVRRNGDVGSFYEWDSARRLADLVPAGIGAKAAAEALRYLKSCPVKTATLPVVFGPLAARALFRGLCAAASAEDVQRRRSFLVGLKGERVASEIVTLVDDPLIAGGLSSGRFDDDGFPHRRLTLVEEGVLQTYLHSNYTAHKSGETNTGHATRVGIAPTNINPQVGRRTAADIISEVDDGIYVELGQPAPDTASGQISALVDAGFRIEKGELTYPLESTMVAGNALEVLQEIDAISSDYRAEPGLVLPTVRVRSLRVASRD